MRQSSIYAKTFRPFSCLSNLSISTTLESYEPHHLITPPPDIARGLSPYRELKWDVI